MSTFLYGAHVHANGIRQHYLRYGGRGPALLLIPGITSPAITWGFVAERLGKNTTSTCSTYAAVVCRPAARNWLMTQRPAHRTSTPSPPR